MRRPGPKCDHSLLLGFAATVFLFGCVPESWDVRTRKESIRVLESVTSTNDLQEAVGNGGVVLTLTNGSWIAIRHVVEFEPDRELAIARDSDGGWFESKTKFSGGLTWYPHYKMPLEPGQRRVTTTECFLLEKVEASSNLQQARERLQQTMGFVPLRK